MTRRTWAGRDAGHGASGLADLRVWMTQDGYVLSTTSADGQRLVLASTSDSPDVAGVPAGTRCELAGSAGLAERVPSGFGLLVDGATPGRRVVSATVVDGLRVREPPRGDEPDLRTDRVPDVLAGVRNSAVAAATRTGAKGATVVWATGGGRAGLWVVVDRPAAGSLDGVYDAVARHAPFDPVQVLDRAELSDQAREVVTRGVAKDGGGSASPPEFSGRANVLIFVVATVGAVLIVLGRDQAGTDGTVLQAVGWALEVLLVFGVIISATGRGFPIPGLAAAGSGGRARPLVFLGFLAICGGLLYQAIRSQS